jgi:predicted CopG family antitoxin
VWLERAVIDRLRSLRGRGESYSDVILRLVLEG